jgi:hypothetical protein
LDEAESEVNIAIRVDDDDGRMEVEDLALPFRQFNLHSSKVKVLYNVLGKNCRLLQWGHWDVAVDLYLYCLVEIALKGRMIYSEILPTSAEV